jgi:hypothetical protein
VLRAPIAGFAGEIIGPWILPRLAWPIPLAAVLVLGWLLWEGLAYVRGRLGRSGSRTERLAGVLLAPLLIFCGLVAAAPSSIAQVETADESGETPQEEVSCSDPVYAWMENGLPAPSTVLAPDEENSCIMARASRPTYSATVSRSRAGRSSKSSWSVSTTVPRSTPTLSACSATTR